MPYKSHHCSVFGWMNQMYETLNRLLLQEQENDILYYIVTTITTLAIFWGFFVISWIICWFFLCIRDYMLLEKQHVAWHY